MNETKTLNLKLPIIIMAWAAVGLCSLSGIYTLAEGEPGFLGFTYILVALAPFALLALYATIFYSNKKLAIFVPIIFALFAYQPLHSLFANIVESEGNASFSYFYYVMHSKLPIMALSVFAALAALKGIKSKTFILPLLALLFIPEWNSLGNLLAYADDISSSYFFSFCDYVGAISGYAALLLFVFNAEFPAIIGGNSTPAPNAAYAENNVPSSATATLD